MGPMAMAGVGEVWYKVVTYNEWAWVGCQSPCRETGDVTRGPVGCSLLSCSGCGRSILECEHGGVIFEEVQDERELEGVKLGYKVVPLPGIWRAWVAGTAVENM